MRFQYGLKEQLWKSLERESSMKRRHCLKYEKKSMVKYSFFHGQIFLFKI
jgi:hypothetical protein